MKDNAKINVTQRSLFNMTDEQFTAFKEQVLAPGRWDSCDGVDVWWEAGFGNGPGTIMVAPYAQDAPDTKSVMILMGIEPDGYCHS